MEVQIFGISKSQDTRRAQRFFAERRVRVHFVDLKERPASKGELQRFVQKFGVAGILDTEGKRYAELGLGAGRYRDETLLDKMLDEPMLLRMPLVRWQQRLTVGAAESEWKAWMEAAKG